MDTLVLNAISQELRQLICPSKINSIVQPGEYSLGLNLWTQGKEYRLMMSVDARYQYLFLTNHLSANKAYPFGKFLQHHIKGGELRHIRKPLLERILTFDIVKKDIGGQDLTFQFILEIMGRYSNIILINQDTGKILDSIRHVTAVQSSYRRIAPGAVYVPPPPQETKMDVTMLDRDAFYGLLRDYNVETETAPKMKLWKFLIQRMKGFSPLLAKEIEGSALNTDDEARWRRFARIAKAVKTGKYQPTLIIDRDETQPEMLRVLSAVPLEQFIQKSQIEICTPVSMNAAAERYYRNIAEQQQFKTIKTSLLSTLSARLSKLQKKRGHLRGHKQQIDNAEDYKREGELITANMYQLKKGLRTASVIDYYEDSCPLIEIALDPKLSPSQNAQRFFKRYNKLKHGEKVTEQRLLATEQEIMHCEELKFFIENAETIPELKRLRDEIRDEIPSTRKKKTVRKNVSQESAQPFLRFVSSDGFDIYVGRSSRENDLLTQRTALPEDIWLHAHRAPGSHAIILNRERNTLVPEQTLQEAASLAAYHSKLRQSGHVDVMYTQKKFVKKPKGSPPGLVTVSQFQIIRVRPKGEI